MRFVTLRFWKAQLKEQEFMPVDSLSVTVPSVIGHQFVFKKAVEWLNEHDIKCEPLKIIWNADSMHLYERTVLDVKKWLEENDGFDPVDTEIIAER